MKTIASHNGLAAAARARELLLAGAAPLDACVEGVTLVEDDPEEHSVGYGGIPNEDGIVELDAGVMDGRTGRGAGVAALRGIRHPSRVARLLMQQTSRVLLVGDGALAFARANGFVEENLLTDKARRIWLHWKRTRAKTSDWREPALEEVDPDVAAWFARYMKPLAVREGQGTVHIAALNDSGDLACCTSTSGHAFKLAGRVGDSPIIGAGLYVDASAGAAGATGRGEAVITAGGSRIVVEDMRRGMSPAEAVRDVLERIAKGTMDPRLRDAKGRPRFDVTLYALAVDGRFASGSLWSGKRFAVHDGTAHALRDAFHLFEREGGEDW